MGMNHAGELTQLTRLVRPHVALVTTVALAHGAFFKDESEIADAKGEIFRGLEPGGIAVIPYDNPHRERLMAAAMAYAGQIVTFGRNPKADVYAREGMPGPKGTFVQARLRTCELSFTVGLPGDHWITNALAVLAVVEAAGGDLAAAGLALADMAGLPGRGRRITIRLADGDALLIDEAYNANPASMRATLSMLGQERGRKVAILGSMRELGPQEAELHAALAQPIAEAGVDLALLVGTEMKPLAEALEGKVEFVHVPDAASAADRARHLIAPGDAILVKGSNSVGLAGVVDALAGG
jgi:UDP-N-acetylmuramoyl-tripeptide--D-alanyl-D-alanine ligase